MAAVGWGREERYAALAGELAALAGGAARLALRAEELAVEGDLRVACELIELAATAAPDDAAVHAARAVIYDARRREESSLMAKGIFAEAAATSRAIAEGEHGTP